MSYLYVDGVLNDTQVNSGLDITSTTNPIIVNNHAIICCQYQ